MIITLKGADFSSNNIGTLSSWTVSRVLGMGATYSGVSSVLKGASFSATITIAEGYELGTAGVTVTMGGVTQSGVYSISGSTITISISSVTGNVVIKVPTKNTSSGSEDNAAITVIEPTTYTLTAGYRFDKRITLTSPTDATLTVLVTAENETYTGYLVVVYVNGDTSRGVHGRIGTPFTVDTLSTDTQLWFFSNALQGLESDETFTITATR